MTSVKTDGTWNKRCQDLYDKPKKIIKKDTYMKYYDVARPLYLENNASSISLGARLLQVRNSMDCGHNEHQKMQYCAQLHLQAKSPSSA